MAVTGSPETADERLTTLSLTRLSDDELDRVNLQLFFERQANPVDLDGTVAYRALSMLATRLARERQQAVDPVAEVRAARELISLRQRVSIQRASLGHRGHHDLAWLVNAYSRLVGRGIHPRELENWIVRMRLGPLDREAVETELLQMSEIERRALEEPRDPSSCWIMGTSRTIALEDWRRRKRELEFTGPRQREAPLPLTEGTSDSGRFPSTLARPRLQGSPRCLISIITSVYRGGRYIEAFLENMCSQSVFRGWCELIVVDAASPEGEEEVVRRWMSSYPNIKYIRAPERIGIYEAWNLAIRESRGEFLTNANVDDLRRHDSLEVQASLLQALPEVDVVYQDVYYAMEHGGSFERIAALGFQSRVPRVTPAVMLAFNPPHNAPMWRRRLHHELGLFDARFRSAGDYEFWLRCVEAGKVFYRVADPHVGYYHNPTGVSTRPGTVGLQETRSITAEYSMRLLAGARSSVAKRTV